MDEQPGIMPRSELAEDARKHYEEVATIAMWHNSIIPQAIDAWEREPELTSEYFELALAKKNWEERALSAEADAKLLAQLLDEAYVWITHLPTNKRIIERLEKHATKIAFILADDESAAVDRTDV